MELQSKFANDQQEVLISYYTLRKLLGILGISLPMVLAVGSWILGGGIQGSISSYYYSLMRDLFVGILTAMALFLFTYTGYKEEGVCISENKITNTAGIMALMVALLPTTTDNIINKVITAMVIPQL